MGMAYPASHLFLPPGLPGTFSDWCAHWHRLPQRCSSCFYCLSFIRLSGSWRLEALLVDFSAVLASE